MNEKPHCFVIGPIGSPGSPERKHADMLLNAVIRHVLETDDFGYEVIRSDKVADPGMINDVVIHEILNCELVVADLSFLNPNAFYELGIRHARMKPTIHFARTETECPFDTVGYRAIIADITDWNGIERAREQLSDMAISIGKNDFRVSNPITQANATFEMQEKSDPKSKMILELIERVKRLEKREDIFAPPAIGHPSREEYKRIADQEIDALGAEKGIKHLVRKILYSHIDRTHINIAPEKVRKIVQEWAASLEKEIGKQGECY